MQLPLALVWDNDPAVRRRVGDVLTASGFQSLLAAAPHDALELLRFSAVEAIEKSGRDYLFFDSRPAAVVEGGGNWRYAAQVKARRGGVNFKLDAGPPGMTLAADGVLQWRAPEPPPGAPVANTVVLSAADAAGQEVFQTFTLWVTPKESRK